jgi:hypothetical protein
MNEYELTFEVRYTVTKTIISDDSEAAVKKAEADIYADVDLSAGTVQDISLIGHEIFDVEPSKEREE